MFAVQATRPATAIVVAAIERGGGLLAEAQDRRQRRTVELERAEDLLPP